jgi:hypothetical protein
MRPKNDKLVEIIKKGFDEACEVSIDNRLADDTEELRKFSGRMSIRLFWAMERIKELESRYKNHSSWEGEVDRQGGAFTDQEIINSLRGGHGW